ncbi:MAG: cytochrome c peroxidase [Paracoccaceae bacterium]|jgi:cytochrome c peroxidase
MPLALALARLCSAALAICAAGAALAQGLPAPVTDDAYRPVNAAAAEVGRLLFYDPILAGGRDISCAGCHREAFGTSDGLSLGLGEGGVGVGPDRRANPDNPPEKRIPRNSQALFNLGAREFRVMFHDGRVEEDAAHPSGLRSPLAEDLPHGLDNVLAAQAMFPVVSPDEMAGQLRESDVSRMVRMGRIAGPDGAWALLAARVAAVPAYDAMLRAAYPHMAGRPVAFPDLANAIAAFIAAEWRSDASPFDAALRGEAPLTGAAADGMALFYGDAGCAACHSGPFQTNHRFHAMGVPQIGPGKALAFEAHSRDMGRMAVTGAPEDAWRFRTPSLRNVLHTGPWGHDGAYADLRDFLAAHGRGEDAYDIARALLPPLYGAVDDAVLTDAEQCAAIAAAAEAPRPDPAWIDPLITFLGSLSDPAALAGVMGAPDAVPSGLEPGL